MFTEADIYERLERLDRIISWIKGECMDCRTPCKKAHPSHTIQCECCDYVEAMSGNNN